MIEKKIKKITKEGNPPNTEINQKDPEKMIKPNQVSNDKHMSSKRHKNSFFCCDFEWKGNLPKKNFSSSEQEDEQQKRVFSDENDLFQMEC